MIFDAFLSFALFSTIKYYIVNTTKSQTMMSSATT